MKRRHDDNPPTVGFNLKEMRESAMQALIDTILKWADDYRELDILERRFHAQHAATVSEVNTRAGNVETRTNGHAPKHVSKAESAALTAAIAAELADHAADGRSIGQIYRSLIAGGWKPTSPSVDAAQNQIRYRVNVMLAQGQITSRDIRPPDGGHLTVIYYPAAKPKRTFSPAAMKNMRANAAKMRARRAAKQKQTT